MNRSLLLLAALALFLAGCSLAGDVTPPPAVATAQAVRPTSTAPALSQPSENEPLPSPRDGTAETQDSEEGQISLVLPSDRPDVGNGERIYAEKCAACHGSLGMGDGEMAGNLEVPVPALGDTEIGRQTTLFDWYRVVTEGRMERFMPPFTSLSDSERLDVAAYALLLSTSERELMLGEESYLDACAGCHAQDGGGSDAIPSLITDSFAADWSAQDLFELITLGQGQMPAFSDVLDPNTRWAVARYVQALSYATGVQEQTTSEDVTAPAAAGTLQGQIINATEGGEVPPGMEVTLAAIEGQSVVFSSTTEADQEGRFVFDELDADPARIYTAFVEYQGVRYLSEGLHFTAEIDSAELPILIYESTSDSSSLRVERLHLIFNPIAEGRMEITEVWVLSGPGDRTIATQNGEGLLVVPLPQGFSDLSLDNGDNIPGRYVATQEGFIDRAPIQPGAAVELVFSFVLPFERQLEFAQPLVYPVDAAVVLLARDGFEIRGEGLQDLGLRDMGGITLRNYALNDLAAGDVLELELSPGRAAFNLGALPMETLLGVGVLGLVLLGVGYWWMRSRASDEAKQYPLPESASDQEAILRAIATLDDEFEAGRLEQQDYRQRRDVLKRQALEMMRGRDD